METASLAISGFASLDSIIVVNKLHRAGETSTIEKIVGLDQPLWGGCACNVAVGCARLGVKTYLLTILGTDASCDAYVSYLQKQNVDTTYVLRVPGKPAPKTFLVIDNQGNFLTLYYPAHLYIERKDMISLEKLSNLKFGVITIGDVQLTECFASFLIESSIPIVWSFKADFKACPVNLIRKLIKNTHLLIINNVEAQILAKILKINTISDLINKGLNSIIITQGAKGCQLITVDNIHNIPAVRPTRVVDTTGAGDAFVAGVMFGLINDLPLSVCAQIGATSASFVLEAWGAQAGLPTLSELRIRYTRWFGPWPL